MEFEVKKTGYDTVQVKLSDKTKSTMKKWAKIAVVGSSAGYVIGCGIVIYLNNKKTDEE